MCYDLEGKKDKATVVNLMSLNYLESEGSLMDGERGVVQPAAAYNDCSGKLQICSHSKILHRI